MGKYLHICKDEKQNKMLGMVRGIGYSQTSCII